MVSTGKLRNYKTNCNFNWKYEPKMVKVSVSKQENTTSGYFKRWTKFQVKLKALSDNFKLILKITQMEKNYKG